MVLDSFPAVSETFIHHHVAALLDGGHEVTIFAGEPAVGPVHEIVMRHEMLRRTRFLSRQRWGLGQLWQVPLSLLESAGNKGRFRSINPVRYGTGALRFRALHALPVFSREIFDILHCHYASIGWAFLPFRDIFGVPLVTSFHGDHYKSFGRRGRHLRTLFRQGDAFIANSGFTASELRAMGCPPEKTYCIPAPSSDEGVRFRARCAGKLGQEGRIRLLCVARLHRTKGIHVLIDAIALLAAAGHNVALTLVGDGPDRGRFEAQCLNRGVGALVQFAGWRAQQDVYREYDAADLLVLPSVGDPVSGSSEAQGVVLQEAMLHGLPVLASEIGGIPESLNYGAAGTLVQPGDSALLTSAIIDVVRHPERTQAKVVAAESYVRLKYLKPAALKAHELVYREAMARFRSGVARSTDSGKGLS